MQISNEEQQVICYLIYFEDREICCAIMDLIFKNSVVQQKILDKFCEVMKKSGNNEHFIDNCIDNFEELAKFKRRTK